jgi:16S rRNA (cytosine967-C5)-methyltransferase
MARPPSASGPEPAGLVTRRIAAEILDNVLRRQRPLDTELEGGRLAALEPRDRALARRLIATVLRRLGSLRHLLGQLLERGAPQEAPRVETALLLGAAQILFLDVPDHAAVDLSVRLVRGDRRGSRFAGLVNAVLRRFTATAPERLRELEAAGGPVLDTPTWLLARWTKNFGAETAAAIAAAHAREPALDLTVKQDPAHWASVLGGRVLPTGTVRTRAHGPVPQLSGYAEGAWWVQDAAAALPARLLGDVADKVVADLCAAPGGKTAQLVAAGARVVAVDRAEDRLVRLRQNLARLDFAAEIVAADVAAWQPGRLFDAVLLDAPCSSTGTIRRHPDIPWVKQESDLTALAGTQRSLLARAAELTRPGGLLVYCTCSLEPEEGVAIVDALLAADSRLRRLPITPVEVYGQAEFLSPAGDLRTFPGQMADPDPEMAGIDGFYAARLQRTQN